MTVQQLAVRVRNAIQPLLTATLQVYQPQTYVALKELCDEMLEAYMSDRKGQEIVGPYGYKIPPLEVAACDLKREPPDCCGG